MEKEREEHAPRGTFKHGGDLGEDFRLPSQAGLAHHPQRSTPISSIFPRRVQLLPASKIRPALNRVKRTLILHSRQTLRDLAQVIKEVLGKGV
jgi:hypothetical protein